MSDGNQTGGHQHLSMSPELARRPTKASPARRQSTPQYLNSRSLASAYEHRWTRGGRVEGVLRKSKGRENSDAFSGSARLLGFDSQVGEPMSSIVLFRAPNNQNRAPTKHVRAHDLTAKLHSVTVEHVAKSCIHTVLLLNGKKDGETLRGVAACCGAKTTQRDKDKDRY